MIRSPVKFLLFFTVLLSTLLLVSRIKESNIWIRAYNDKSDAVSNIESTGVTSDYSEYIQKYKSNITVDPKTSDLIVTEDITVNIAHKSIRHGIYRDFPLYYKAVDTHESYKVGFHLLETKLDNELVQYHIKDIKNGIRIYLGQEDELAPLGLHTYTIKYRVSKEMRFFKDHDEIYWNVTGNDWLFPIRQVEAIVRLPFDVANSALKYKAYTGAYGKTGADYIAQVNKNSIIFTTTRVLTPKEGLTIVVGFPKGFVYEPSASQKLINRLVDNIPVLIATLGAILIAYLLYSFWKSYGKDPELGSIMPMFKPPETLDPATVRAVYKGTYSNVDNKSMSSMLVYLAVKGYIKIKQVDKKKFKLILKKDVSKEESFEAKLLKALFGTQKSIILGASKGDYDTMTTIEVVRRIQKFKNKLQLYVNKQLKLWWKSNLEYLIKLFFIAAVVIGLVFITGVNSHLFSVDEVMNMLAVYGFFIIGAFSFYYFAYNKNPRNWKFYFTLYSIFLMFILSFTIPVVSILIYVSFVLITILLTLAWVILPRYTDEGIRIKREVLGFKEYLGTAEQDRLNYLNPPELTVQLFEKYLPYAMALDVAHKWAKKFTKVFQNMAQNNKNINYMPLWYIGYNNNLQLDNLTKTLDNTLSNVITSAGKFSSAGGSSGFSGGFSGGGGGGGGGGGW